MLGRGVTVGTWQPMSNNGGNGVSSRSENRLAAVLVARAEHLMTSIRVRD